MTSIAIVTTPLSVVYDVSMRSRAQSALALCLVSQAAFVPFHLPTPSYSASRATEPSVSWRCVLATGASYPGCNCTSANFALRMYAIAASSATRAYAQRAIQLPPTSTSRTCSSNSHVLYNHYLNKYVRCPHHAVRRVPRPPVWSASFARSPSLKFVLMNIPMLRVRL